ncbi:hypothetical protein CBR_g23548 [Chara braunii]|uniref:Reverse transcriptase domain-containing protein n=1 Tax=Chara braunii TaxID=69332 RepID=A0A388L4I8_CHABU|nr:hypothetical protein CBR_g23548 [Chara braunii]|eukprot:GBG77221.1 hypothetical protein CBR_g23548 [Chara braunii]
MSAISHHRSLSHSNREGGRLGEEDEEKEPRGAEERVEIERWGGGRSSCPDPVSCTQCPGTNLQVQGAALELLKTRPCCWSYGAHRPSVFIADVVHATYVSPAASAAGSNHCGGHIYDESGKVEEEGEDDEEGREEDEEKEEEEDEAEEGEEEAAEEGLDDGGDDVEEDVDGEGGGDAGGDGRGGTGGGGGGGGGARRKVDEQIANLRKEKEEAEEAGKQEERRRQLLVEVQKVVDSGTASVYNKSIAEMVILNDIPNKSYFSNWDHRISAVESQGFAIEHKRGPKLTPPPMYSWEDPKVDVSDWVTSMQAYLGSFTCPEATKVGTILGRFERTALKWCTSFATKENIAMDRWAQQLGVAGLLKALQDRFADREQARKAADKIMLLGSHRFEGSLSKLYSLFESLTSTPGLEMSESDQLFHFLRAAPPDYSIALYAQGHKDWRSFGKAALDLESRLKVQTPSEGNKRPTSQGQRRRKGALLAADGGSDSDASQRGSPPSETASASAVEPAVLALAENLAAMFKGKFSKASSKGSASQKGKGKGRASSPQAQRPNLPRDVHWSVNVMDPSTLPWRALRIQEGQWQRRKDREEKKKHKSDLILLRPSILGTKIKGLLDCGATRNFISPKAVSKLHLDGRLVKLQQPLEVRLGNSSTVRITSAVKNLPVIFDKQEKVRQRLNFYVFPNVPFDLVFSMQWLEATNPRIDWQIPRVELPECRGDYQPCVLANEYHPVSNCYCMRAHEFFQLSRQTAHTRLFVAYAKQTGVDVAPCPSPIQQVFDSYPDLMQEPTELVHRETQHRIELLPGAVPPKGHVYRMSPAELDELRRRLETLTNKVWIKPNTSEFGAPVLFVPKGIGEFRMCVDYRGLNKITRKSTEPLPRIDDLLDMVQGCTIFSKIDLKSDYHQIEMVEGDVPKTAFKTRYGTYEYLVMPFGLCNAPGTFQAEMHRILRPYLDRFVVVYLDDIWVFSRSVEEHAQHLALVLQALHEAQYKINREKSSFGVTSVTYLGHVISGEGLAPEAP